MIVDSDCDELGLERPPTVGAAWRDDRRAPLYREPPVEGGGALTYDVKHLYEGECADVPGYAQADSSSLYVL